MPSDGKILAEKQKVHYARHMNNAAVPMVLYTCLSGFQRQEATRKIFARFYPRNPLKNHDSNERIQGNPNKSNP
jgi:hypothetical protein